MIYDNDLFKYYDFFENDTPTRNNTYCSMIRYFECPLLQIILSR